MTRFPIPQALCQTPLCMPYMAAPAFLGQYYDYLCFANQKSERLNDFPKAHGEQVVRIENIKEAELVPLVVGLTLIPDIPSDLEQCALGLGGKPARNFSLSRWDSGRMVKLGLRRSTEPARAFCSASACTSTHNCGTRSLQRSEEQHSSLDSFQSI